MSSLGTALIIWLDYNEHFILQENIFFRHRLARLFLLGLAVTFGLTVGYSRLFLGVHSIDQIIFGWSLGIWLAISCHFVMKKPLNRHSEDLCKNNPVDIRQSIFLTTIFFVLCLGAEITTYWVVNPTIVNDPEWRVQI